MGGDILVEVKVRGVLGGSGRVPRWGSAVRGGRGGATTADTRVLRVYVHV